MTDDELIAKTAAARGTAHRAPFAEWSKDHRGHSSIVNHTTAWAERGKWHSSTSPPNAADGTCHYPTATAHQAHAVSPISELEEKTPER